MGMEVPENLKWLAKDTMLAEKLKAERNSMWSVVLGVQPKLDGNMYICCWGENLQEGIVGVGATPIDAMNAFDKAMRSEALAPNQLIRQIIVHVKRDSDGNTRGFEAYLPDNLEIRGQGISSDIAIGSLICLRKLELNFNIIYTDVSA